MLPYYPSWDVLVVHQGKLQATFRAFVLNFSKAHYDRDVSSLTSTKEAAEEMVVHLFWMVFHIVAAIPFIQFANTR